MNNTSEVLFYYWSLTYRVYIYISYTFLKSVAFFSLPYVAPMELVWHLQHGLVSRAINKISDRDFGPSIGHQY